MSAALRQLRHRAEDYADAAQDGGRQVAGQAFRYADQASSRLGELWSEIETLVSRRGPELTERARGYASEAASDLSHQLVAVTRQRPLVAIGVAVAATWLVSSLLHSARRSR